METAIIQQEQLYPRVHNIQQTASNNSEEEDLSSIPCLISVKKSHSTPHNSLADKINQFSDRQQQQKENELHEIKEQEKVETSKEEQVMNRNKQNSAQQQKKKQEKDVEMRKISTAASEELKTDYPQQLSKSNSSSQCNLLDYKNTLIDSNDQRSDMNFKQESVTNIQRQEESKKLQTLYQESSERNKLFEEKIRKSIKEFALDKYSHFVLILILDIGPSGHKRIIIESTLKEKELFSHEQFGHKILNKCIEVSKKEFIDLYNEFIKYILDNQSKTYQTLQNDKFGNYVIQKCLEIFDEDHLSQLLILLNATLLIKPEQKLPNLTKENQSKDSDLCSDQYGCLIIQKLIEIYKTKPDSKIKKQVGQMIEKVINDSHRLAQRQFSNYVVQQIIEKGAPEHKNMLYQNVISKCFISLAMDKYGSNVAEKAIKYAEQDQKKQIWGLISSNNFNALLNMVNDQYANYVVQRIFDSCLSKEQKQIHQQLSQLSKKNLLKENGKHPFKYIDDLIRQHEFHNSNNTFRNNQSKQTNQDNFCSNNQHTYQTRQNQNMMHNNLQQSSNFSNPNINMEYNQNIKQSNYALVNKNNFNSKNQHQNTNQSSFNQKHRQNNSSNQMNPEMKNPHIQNSYNQESPSSNKQAQKFDQNKFSKNSNRKQQTQNSQQQFQNVNNNNFSQNKNQNVESDQSQGQQNNYDNQIRNSNYNNYNSGNANNNQYSSYGKRNQYRNQNSLQSNSNKAFRRQNNNRGNYNYHHHHPIYYQGYPQQYFMQQPYFGFTPYIYVNQPAEFTDPQLINYFDPNNLINPPYLDFLQGAHIKVLQNQNNNNDVSKQEQQSEITTQPNSLNSPQTNFDKKVDDNQENQTKQQDSNEANK
ncbi:hypothetical protein ABPG72_001017 [Tetrahymena utriculariae]